MKTNNKLGIWMNHSEARLIPYLIEDKSVSTIRCQNACANRRVFKNNSDCAVKTIRRQQQEFYVEIMSTIRGYDEVLLFGPTNAKLELFDLISDYPPADNFKVSVQSAARMTDNELHSYVKNHFKPVMFGGL
jgi:hypothetical protein